MEYRKMRIGIWAILLIPQFCSLSCLQTKGLEKVRAQITLPKMIVIPDDASEVVMTGIQELKSSFVEIGRTIDVLPESEVSSKQLLDSFIFVGAWNKSSLLQKISEKNSIQLTEENVGKEGYLLKVVTNPWNKGKITVVSALRVRGLLYGAYRLSTFIRDNRGVPANLSLTTKPFFAIREWQTMTLQANFNLPLGGAFDRPPEELLALTKRIIRKAPYYGINALILTGRSGEGGIDLSWFLKYRKYPKLYQYYKYDHARDERTRIIREIAIECHKHGLELLLWDHELIFPSQLLKLYPPMKGKRYPIEYQAMLKFVGDKVDECFEVVPEVDGLVLTFSEVGRGGHKLFESGAQAIHDVAMAMYEACKRNGKRLEVRSYYESGEAAKMMEEAFKGTPKDMVVMSKCDPYDFFGTRRLDNPMFGKVSNMQIAEFTCCREDNGHGFIPGIAPLHYKRKLEYEIDKGIVGVAARVDYHLQYSHAHGFNPGPAQTTFDRPNEFDVVVLSRMMWNPQVDIDSLWISWAHNKYGKKAAPYIVSALKRTEDITQKTFFLQDEYVIHQHNQVTDLLHMKNNLSGPKTQYYWDPSNKILKERLQKINHPNEEILAEFIKEKEEAVELANLSLGDMRKAKPYMEAEMFHSLYRSMEIEREAAVLWRYIAEMFFRYLMWEQGTGDRVDNLEKLNLAGQAYLEQAQSIEERFGRVWPVYRAARGIYSYYEIIEFWQPQLLKIIAESSQIEQIWDAINLLKRPKRVADTNRLRVQLAGDIGKIEFKEKYINVYSKSNQVVKIPLGIEVEGEVLYGGEFYYLTFHRTDEKVKISN